jgi:transcription-repair coupling factor (superfamily II helicase)
LNSKDIFKLYKEDARVQKIIKSSSKTGSKTAIKGLVGSLDAWFLGAYYAQSQQNMLIVLPDKDSASYCISDLENILQKDVLLFPASLKRNLDLSEVDTYAITQRAETLNALTFQQEYGNIIVTYPEAIIEQVMDQGTLENNTLNIKVGDKLSIDFIQDFLIEYEFERVDFVYEPGQYAIRGGIVDIFSYAHENPYRLELFGDYIESIRTFDPIDQLSVKQVKDFTLLRNVNQAKQVEGISTLFQYLNKTTPIFIYNTPICFELADMYCELKERYAESDSETAKTIRYIDSKQLKEIFAPFSVVEYGKQQYYSDAEIIAVKAQPQPSFNKDFNLLNADLWEQKQEGYHNFIFTDSPKQVERLYAIFEDLKKEQGQTEIPFSIINIALREGFVDQGQKIACFTDHQIFNRFYRGKQKRGYNKSFSLTLKELRDLKQGDFVTHIDHGIGKFMGLQKIDVNGKKQECVRLQYADGDTMFVSVNTLYKISKFTGKDGTEPKLHKLGSNVWEKLKKNTKKKVKDIARELIQLYAKRKAQKGNAFNPDNYLQTELEASFIYEDTPDQIKATIDVKKDMEEPHPMDRLICGDVGFGKTEIAVRAAFKAVCDNKQVAILVPTTILASQHYKTFKERLSQFPCTVDFVNRFKSTKDINAVLDKVEEGKIDIVIGTHRLLSKDVKFKDLGLIIIDEEQKFGVSAKEKLKAMRVNVDTLTLTATPIPRTLHFSLMGARDLSIINTPPPNRQPVNTELHVFNDQIIQNAIEREVERGGQVFFIHNRVKDIYALADKLRTLCPDVRIGVGHGQLPGEELEEVMLKFVSGDYDVLLATTIIESGIDISNANTIIINHAHMFGLSDLHQMRGRVGRSNIKAYCYLLSPPLSTLTPEARKRLSAIEEFNELGSGFNIAMRDLDIRGAGNLLGAEQSGFINEIGYEMYHKILDEAIQELKEEEFQDVFKDSEQIQTHSGFCVVETDEELMIPDTYVTNINERLSLYTELNNLSNLEEIAQFSKMLEDRFGPIPELVQRLFEIIQLQWEGKRLGFTKIVVRNHGIRLHFPENPQSKYFNSPIFQNILQYLQEHPSHMQLKEKSGLLQLIINTEGSTHQALEILQNIR